MADIREIIDNIRKIRDAVENDADRQQTWRELDAILDDLHELATDCDLSVCWHKNTRIVKAPLGDEMVCECGESWMLPVIHY